MHKFTKLLPYQREVIYNKWLQGETPTNLSRQYEVSRTTIYKVLKRGKENEFTNRKSTNRRYQIIQYGLKRLTQVEKQLRLDLAKRERRNNRYGKTFPGEMVHLDSKLLPHLEGETRRMAKREYLFVAIDDYSRALFTDILPNKTQSSGAQFLENAIRAFPFQFEVVYSDNGGEFKGSQAHAVVKTCQTYGICQQFTKPRTPKTNGKAERVIKTLLNEWFRQQRFSSPEQRRQSLYQYVVYYNQERSHQGIGNLTPLQKLQTYFTPPLTTVPAGCESVNNA